MKIRKNDKFIDIKLLRFLLKIAKIKGRPRYRVYYRNSLISYSYNFKYVIIKGILRFLSNIMINSITKYEKREYYK